MKEQLKMAVVGLGTWGENHIQIYQDDPFVTVTAVCDQNPERAAGIAEKYGISQYYTDYEEMFDKADMDTVAIVTPDFAHKDIAVSAARHGKHMLIEKPLATTADDVRVMVDEINRCGVRAMVDLHNRFSPPFHAAWQSIRNGNLCEAYSGYFRLNDIKCNIMGTKGMISIDASNHTMIQEYTENSVRIPDVIVSNKIFGRPKGFAYDSIRAFTDCLINNREFPVSISDAANTTLTLLAIMESAGTRMPVEVNGLYPVNWKSGTP